MLYLYNNTTWFIFYIICMFIIFFSSHEHFTLQFTGHLSILHAKETAHPLSRKSLVFGDHPES